MATGEERYRINHALNQADLRVLLMCLYQVTGDHGWLEAPFTPERDIQLIADPSAGLSSETQDQIRQAAYDVLTSEAVAPAVPLPDEDLLREMMSVCLGERVPAEYSPMMRSEMGFVSNSPTWANGTTQDHLPKVIIVGAGLSGIALGAELSQLEIPYVVFEKNEEVGGTWWENTYPGAGVDTPNHAYSYSRGTPFHWSRFFALRDEIQEYIENCADEFGVRPNVRFSTKVVGAWWDEDQRVWHVDVCAPDGTVSTHTAEFLVPAVGVLNTPQVPEFPGLGTFTGESFHSARWPAGQEMAGKDVAVVGTGASAMQVVPALVNSVRSLTIYQRSPHWIRPVAGYRDSMPPGIDLLMARMPFYREWFRFTMFWRYGDGLLKTLYKDPDWPHPERSVNRRNDLHREELTAFIHAELRDRPDLVEKCVPTYPPFAKRILIDNGWYQALRQEHVALVTSPITQIEDNNVVTDEDQRRHADVLVFATGFDVTRLAADLNIRGRNDVNLADAWDGDNPTAYLGMAVPGFPNMFCLLGPNSALGHGGSTIFQSECQARYIAACVVASVEHRFDQMEVRREVHDAYVQAVDAEHQRLIWTHPGMTNWYRNRRGRVVAIMPWRLVDFWHMTREPKLSEYITQEAPTAQVGT